MFGILGVAAGTSDNLFVSWNVNKHAPNDKATKNASGSLGSRPFGSNCRSQQLRSTRSRRSPSIVVRRLRATPELIASSSTRATARRFGLRLGLMSFLAFMLLVDLRSALASDQRIVGRQLAVQIDSFGRDPTQMMSTVPYYEIKFTVGNIGGRAVEIAHVETEFITTESGIAGPRKVFSNTLSWTNDIDNPESAKVTEHLAPGEGRHLSVSGHFAGSKGGFRCRILIFNHKDLLDQPFEFTLKD